MQRRYFKAYFETNKKDSKKIWFGIKTLIYTKTRKSVSQKLTLNIDNKTISDDHIIANHFNSFFTSIAGKLLKKIPKAKKISDSFLTKSNAKTFFLSPTTPEEVLNELKTFNLNKASGPNCILVEILKDMKSEISVSLSTLTNLSFHTGIFPSSLKLARVMPIFKKGDQQDCNNYRPISVLSNISKLIEKLLYNRLYKFLNH